MHQRPFPARRSIRLRGYDYTRPGGYFVTICARRGTYPFGKIVGDRLQPSTIGTETQRIWLGVRAHFPLVHLDAYCLMPNHFHGIIWIYDGPSPNRPHLGVIVRAFKAEVARRARRSERIEAPFWHRNYYESVIRDRRHLDAIRRYIANNPGRWGSTHRSLRG